MQASNVAYSMPGGERVAPSRARPVDLVHLARQTMGDRRLEEEVLTMFLRQAASVSSSIQVAAPEKRGELAHLLKGSARGIGAFGVADVAEQVEAAPDDLRLLRLMARRIREVRDFVASINR